MNFYCGMKKEKGKVWMGEKALGRGLGALMKDLDSSEESQVKESKGGIEQLYIEDVFPNEDQPRTHFSEEGLSALRDSIREKGVLLPILVRPYEQGYQIIAGERRYRCCKELGLKYIPAIVREASDVDTLEIALIENIHREDLGIIEKARAYKDLMEGYGYTHEDLAKKIGIDRSTISNTVRLLRLPVEILELLDCGDVPFSVGRMLVGLSSEVEQLQVCDYYLRKKVSVKELEQYIKKDTEERGENIVDKDPNIEQLREKLVQKWGMRIDVNYSQSKQKGRIVIHCDSLEDFDRVLESVDSRL